MHFKSILLFVAASLQVSSAKNFTWTGSNEAGAEFGDKKLPGRLGFDYIWPTNESIDTLARTGMNTFRIPFKMERLIPKNLSGPINETYFDGLQKTVNHITGKGLYAVVDPHNYGRYYGKVITNVTGFGAWWTTVATRFKNNRLVIFDTNNEFYGMRNELVRDLNQAAINAIRAAGARTQYIWVEGNSWSGAHSWVSSGNGATLVNLIDPSNRTIYEMHQYLDSDSSGTSSLCQSPTVGRDRLRAATEWLRRNGKKGVIGEVAAGNNRNCKIAIRGMLQYLKDNSDVWTGWVWWSAGPWWGNYMFSMEPPNGIAYRQLLPEIRAFIGI
ncbi:unnamed protein product [Clonostachys rosea f. rosea IK726]|uniref:cellulase n=2 Tax=Bionectria ochroleuca TaxID=29856 RepID=A0A0B7KNG9_BIOOC|nr:unnamed protein product [Clonostachys rosea f. rosea IK726]